MSREGGDLMNTLPPVMPSAAQSALLGDGERRSHEDEPGTDTGFRISHRIVRRASQPAKGIHTLDSSDEESHEESLNTSAASSLPSSPEVKPFESKIRTRSFTESIMSIPKLHVESSYSASEHDKYVIQRSGLVRSNTSVKAPAAVSLRRLDDSLEPRVLHIYRKLQHMTLNSVRHEMWQRWQKASDFSAMNFAVINSQLLSDHVHVNLSSARQEILRVRQEVDDLWTTTLRAMEQRLSSAKQDFAGRLSDARAQAHYASNEAINKIQIASKDLHGRIERFRTIIASSGPVSLRGIDVARLPELKAALKEGLPALPQLSNLPADVKEALLRHEASMQQSVESFVRAFHIGRSRLLDFSELPKEWQDNPYVQHGYRFYGSHWGCVHSICTFHNESCNIWTHLGGSLLIVWFAFWIYPQTSVYQTSTIGDELIMAIFFAAALKCLICSTIWHTFAGSAELRVFRAVACVDYIGISVLIAASVVTMEWYGFYTAPTLRIGYIVCTSSMGVLGTIVPWMAWFDRPENRKLKITFFLLLAMSALLPLAHLALRHSISDTFTFFKPIIPSIALYVAGLTFYAGRFPERWYPGKIFDWFGGSHMIWHLAIVAAIYAHFAAVASFHAQRYLFDPQSQHAEKTLTRILLPPVHTYLGESAATQLASLLHDL